MAASARSAGPLWRSLLRDHPAKVGVATLGAVAAVAVVRWLRGRPSHAPDYSQADAWFVQEARGGKGADVFYAHPTSAWGLMRWNMAWDDKKVCTGLTSAQDYCKGQAGAWTSDCNLWAPKYRQMGMLSQMQNLESAGESKLRTVQKALGVAAADLKRAFRSFLASRPDKQRPFLVAAHSQGAVLMSKVLADCVEGTEHEPFFVAAYLCGSYLPADLFAQGSARGSSARAVFRSIHPCTGPDDVGCIIAYDTRTTAFKAESINHIGPRVLGLGIWPHHMHWLLHDRYCERPHGTDDRGKPRIQISPQTWSTAPGGEHRGVNPAFRAPFPTDGTFIGAPLRPPAGFAAKTRTNGNAVVVEDPEAWLRGVT